jgi:hypothetical protein
MQLSITNNMGGKVLRTQTDFNKSAIFKSSPFGKEKGNAFGKRGSFECSENYADVIHSFRERKTSDFLPPFSPNPPSPLV